VCVPPPTAGVLGTIQYFLERPRTNREAYGIRVRMSKIAAKWATNGDEHSGHDGWFREACTQTTQTGGLGS
jgi:hypothetical protein